MMTSDVGPPAPNPCPSCPYRRDVPSGVWSTREYEKLPQYDGPTWEQSPRLFQCHQNERESNQARLCAGWVGCHGGEELLALRIAASNRTMAEDHIRASMRYTTTVPLWPSGAAAAEHGTRDIDHPSEAASEMIEKISGRRTDVEFG